MNATPPAFEPGDTVVVSGQGNGTIDRLDDEAGWYIVELENGTPYRAAESSLTPRVTPSDVEPGTTAVSEPPSVFEDLGRAYERSTADRREVFPILPGRFKGNLAMRAMPVDSAIRKKKVRRIAKSGITDETEARYAAEIIADACETILVRMADGEDYVPANEVPDSGLGAEPVRFDQRLGQVVPTLGKILNGSESPAAVVRLLFKNIDALDSFYVEIDQWLKEASPTEEGEEEGEVERPS